ENVFATPEGPVVVDAEMLLGPAAAGASAEEHDTAAEAWESCLASGLLGWSHADGRGRLFEAGGLQPAAPRGRTLPGRRWVGLGTDTLHFVQEESFLPPTANRVVWEGRLVRPEDFAAEVVQGFERTYEFLLEHRREILSPEGPLGAFAGLATRVLFRPSDQYGAFLRLLQTPSRQDLGVARSVALEALNAVFARDAARPTLWPLVEDERAALEGLDIPRFTLATTGVSPRSRRGIEVEGHYVRSGLESARLRLEALSGGDLPRQRALVEAALASPALPDRNGGEVGDDSLLPAAVALARSLQERCHRGALLASPFTASGDLYRGHTGVAVFLCALGAIAGGEWAETGRRAARGWAEAVSAQGAERYVGPGLGACSGLGSLVYGLTLCAALSGEEVARDVAARLAAGVTPERAERSDAFDVEGGVAGLLLALLALHRETREPGLLSTASACGRRLVAAQREAGAGGAWPASDGGLHAGFAHGAAGIASALARLHSVAGEEPLTRAVARAHRFERSLYSPARGNWPHVRGRGGTMWLMAWCHGAPGVALGRLLEGGAAADPEGGADLETALAATRRTLPGRYDHLCCGSLGQAEVLLAAGRARSDPELGGEAAERARAVARRILCEGWRGVRSTGFEQRAFEPGFFRGLAGVGYQLLRTAHPDRLPSVLGFEPSAERSRG
ncbi:MAG TPA: type 2 lanthipeptide synthetase LanM, partial [Anaeromyxobacteraceae bacterium]|nr:type 2 lanthipeptide synthetase LanM [Anaeromyxobacteraceae bacterium]